MILLEFRKFLTDLVEFDFRQNKWKKYSIKNLIGRYEHTMLTSNFDPESVFLFAGCTETGNSNDLISVNLRKLPLEAKIVETSGPKPSPRTFSSTSACDGDKFFVFGGGLETSKATDDVNVYCLSVKEMEWKKLKNAGVVPTPRQGHSLSLLNDKLVCFGGMNAGQFYSDVFVYDLTSESWQKMKPKGSLPCPRAAHASCVVGEKIIINGGLCLDAGGSLQDMYILNTSNFKWQLVNINGPLPGNRLGHCILPLPDKCLKCYEPSSTESTSSANRTADENKENEQSKGPTILDVTGQLAEQVTRPTGDSTDDTNEPNENGDNTQTSAAKSNLEDSKTYPVEKSDLKSISKEELDITKFVVFGGLDTSGLIFDDTFVVKLL